MEGGFRVVGSRSRFPAFKIWGWGLGFRREGEFSVFRLRVRDD